MDNLAAENNYLLNIVIVKYGLGSKVISIAKKCGIFGGTIITGKGTAKKSLLSFFELADSRKEIVLVLANFHHECTFLANICKELRFDKPNSGIAFSIPTKNVMATSYGADSKIKEDSIEREGVNLNLYDAIFVIVDRGDGNAVVEAANEGGAKGATIINARGSGIHETAKLFSFEIEPEKEVVLILIEKKLTKQVCASIKEKTRIEDPGKGIMFVQGVSEAFGLQ